MRIALTLAVLAAPCFGQEAAPIPPERLAGLQKLIKPQADEWKWARIPWMSDLGEARKKAAAEGKPLYVWTMAGEPLGQC